MELLKLERFQSSPQMPGLGLDLLLPSGSQGWGVSPGGFPMLWGGRLGFTLSKKRTLFHFAFTALKKGTKVLFVRSHLRGITCPIGKIRAFFFFFFNPFFLGQLNQHLKNKKSRCESLH